VYVDATQQGQTLEVKRSNIKVKSPRIEMATTDAYRVGHRDRNLLDYFCAERRRSNQVTCRAAAGTRVPVGYPGSKLPG